MRKITQKESIKMSITLAALKEENKFENGDINWNYVDADVTMEHPFVANNVIVELLNECADAYYNTTGKVKQQCTALRNIDFPSIDFTDGMLYEDRNGAWKWMR